MVYIAGIENASPQTYPARGIKNAIMMLAGALYENREAEVLAERSGTSTVLFALGLNALIDKYRVEFPF